MENNFAKQQTNSSFTQPNYGANYYAPPSFMEISNHNIKITNDLESASTQNTADRSLFGMDLDAHRAQNAKQTFQVDQAGMYVPVFPNRGGITEPMLHPNHACTKCYDCQMRIQREIEEKKRKERQCLDDCNTFCEVCGAVLMLCDIMIQCCALCDAAK